MVMSMLESVSDLVSLIVMIASVLAGIYYLYSVSNLHRSIELKKKEDNYYSLLDDLSSDEDDEEDSRDGTEAM